MWPSSRAYFNACRRADERGYGLRRAWRQDRHPPGGTPNPAPARRDLNQRQERGNRLRTPDQRSWAAAFSSNDRPDRRDPRNRSGNGKGLRGRRPAPTARRASLVLNGRPWGEADRPSPCSPMRRNERAGRAVETSPAGQSLSSPNPTAHLAGVGKGNHACPKQVPLADIASPVGISVRQRPTVRQTAPRTCAPVPAPNLANRRNSARLPRRNPRYPDGSAPRRPAGYASPLRRFPSSQRRWAEPSR